MCTAYSADTSWRFAAHYLDMRITAERTAMFAAAELALFSMALMARQNLHGPRQAAGLPGVLVWLITAMQTIPAYAESGPVGGTVRALPGPVMAAVLWHLAMGIELRQRTPDAASRGLAAVLIRQARERLLARLGIVEQDQGAAQIIRDRATQRAVALAARLAGMTPEQRTGRAGRRTVRRLSEALARSGIDTEPRRNEQLLRQLATRRQAAALATFDLPERWTPPAGQPAHSTARPLPGRRRGAGRRPRPPAPIRSGRRGIPPGRPGPGLPAWIPPPAPARERQPARIGRPARKRPFRRPQAAAHTLHRPSARRRSRSGPVASPVPPTESSSSSPAARTGRAAGSDATEWRTPCATPATASPATTQAESSANSRTNSRPRAQAPDPRNRNYSPQR